MRSTITTAGCGRSAPRSHTTISHVGTILITIMGRIYAPFMLLLLAWIVASLIMGNLVVFLVIGVCFLSIMSIVRAITSDPRR